HARLAAGGGAPAEIDAAAEQLLAEIDAAETEDPGTRALLWAVRAWAAAARGEPGARIAALEALLRLPEQVRSRDEFVAADADTLWDAWLAYGKALGNRKHLLVGDDGPWYFAASEAYDERPFEARGLFAVLALTSRDAEHRALAHEYFADLTRQRPGGLLLLRRLYLESGRFPSHAAVPEAVRHALVDQALNAGDIDLASELTAGLTEPPPGADRVQWRMRRARALLLGGHPAAGLEALEALVADAAELEGEGLDRLVQILFDLQNLERHAKAVELFERLLALELDAKRRRELLFWTADSYRALDRHARAALYYLRSATLPDPFAMDRWAQSARFQAAESLVRAGYLEDARRLYRGLLNVTKDPAQRALLRRKIEQVEARE
nr:hypothetical protein [Gammaproteobacteria bacterium]